MADASFDREMSVYIAKLADKAERFHEVVDEMTKVATNVDHLTPEERKLFAGGFRNVIVRKRNSYKMLSKIEQKDETRSNEENLRRVTEYKERVKQEIMDIWNDVTTILNHHLIPSIQTANASVCFYTMKGDFWRYLAEVRTGSHRMEATQEANSAYEVALEAAPQLSRAHPLRLRLDLNLAVFYHTILEDTQRACRLVDRTFDEAIPVLSDLNPDDYKESNSLMQILDDNMNIWNESSEFAGNYFTFR